MQKSMKFIPEGDGGIKTQLAIPIVILCLIIVSACSSSKKLTGYKVNFGVPVTNSEASDSIRRYRNLPNISAYKKTKFVWYDADVITKYMTETYPDLKSKIQLPNDSFKIVVGFYFMRRLKDHSKDKRNSFYVIPTLYNHISGEIYDFRDYYNWYMDHLATDPKTGKKFTDDQVKLAYNAGQMYP